MVPDIQPIPGTLPVILDTEIGGEPDDAMALVIAARELPELALVVTSDELGGQGAQRARFARHLLDCAGRPDVAVVAGERLSATAPYFAHGLTPDWVASPSRDVARAVARAGARSAGAVRWIGLGPSTNLAGLLARQPGLGRRLFVTQLTGAVSEAARALPPRNFRLDPEAARRVLGGGLPHLRLVSFTLPAGQQAQLTAASPTIRRLADAASAESGPTQSRPTYSRPPLSWPALLAAHCEQFFARYHPAVFPAAPLALAAALRLPFTSFGPAQVTVSETGAMNSGPGSNVLINRDVDYRALGEWLRSRLQPPAWSQWSAGNRPAGPARPARTPWAARV